VVGKHLGVRRIIRLYQSNMKLQNV